MNIIRIGIYNLEKDIYLGAPEKRKTEKDTREELKRKQFQR